MSITVQGSELARVLGNVLPFTDKNSRIKSIVLVVDDGTLKVSGSDAYTLGVDEIPVSGPDGAWLVPLEAAAATAKEARAQRKAEFPLDLSGLDVVEDEVSAAAYPKLLELLGGVSVKTTGASFPVALDPVYLARLAKVKPVAGSTERLPADLYYKGGESNPVLVKIGPTWRGLIMPVHRDTHAENMGDQGLW